MPGHSWSQPINLLNSYRYFSTFLVQIKPTGARVGLYWVLPMDGQFKADIDIIQIVKNYERGGARWLTLVIPTLIEVEAGGWIT